ncbi:hypothetical protein B7494_g2256 [Chlorociboria aeruginascens]|nr:hypothetical protein B7494_g2256 [Chlorociboria aeruginascens]
MAAPTSLKSKNKASKKRKADTLTESSLEPTTIVAETFESTNPVSIAPIDNSTSSNSPQNTSTNMSSTTSSKLKRENSKRKRDVNGSTASLPESETAVPNAPDSTVSTSASTAFADDSSPCMTQDSEAPSKPMKEKSSRKRKSHALTEDILESVAPSEFTPADNSMSLDITHAPAINPMTDGEYPTKKHKASVEEIEVDINAPEPLSKKALRALKKGKPLPPSKSGAESTPELEKNVKTEKEREKRSEYGVWIGNLPWTVSQEELQTFLVERSGISKEMITRVNMPGPNDKTPANKVHEQKSGKKVHNKGFAYVDFSNEVAVIQAVGLSEQLLSGRRLLIKNHKSFEGRPMKTNEDNKNGIPPSKKVFMGNLSFDTTEESIKEHFVKCGSIESVKVATFEDSGKCKGYAWVVFEDLEAAKNAVRGHVLIEDTDDDSQSESKGDVSKPKKTKWFLNNIKGRPLRIEFAEDAQVRYKKRYGKDGTKRANVEPSGDTAMENEAPSVKNVEYRTPYAARLIGGIIESKGKKVTF